MPNIPPALDIALQALGRRRGLSSMLRAHEKALNRAVSDAFAQSPADPDALAGALETARDCLTWVRAQTAGGDAAELPELEHLVTVLEGTPSRPAPPIPTARAPAAPRPIPQARSARKPPATPIDFVPPPRPENTAAIISSLLANLTGFYLRRERMATDLTVRWRELRAIDMQIENAAQAFGWLAEDARAPARAALAAADDAGPTFAAALALLQSGDVDPVWTLLLDPALPAANAAGALLALRTSTAITPAEPRPESLADAPPLVREGLLAIMGDAGRLSRDHLIDLLNDPNDRLVARAAVWWAWLGVAAANRHLLQSALDRGGPPVRLGPLRCAAVVTGSERTLEEIRRLADTGESITSFDIDALAAAGSLRDAERLLRVARDHEDLAALATLAAAHLGNLHVIASPAVAAGDPEIEREARRMVLGDATDAAPPAGSDRRWLHGAPWTSAGVLARLVDPQELVRARRWYALELVARTAAHTTIVFDEVAPRIVQERALEGLRATSEAQRPLPPGLWYYLGQPVR